MIDTAISILEALAGVPASTVGVGLLLYAIYRMARHEVLLFGSVTRDEDGITDECGQPFFTYSFLIQNLEEVTFPGPFTVILRDRRFSEDPRRKFDVTVLAGPRHVVAWRIPEDETKAPEELHARFERLSPFDTWRIEVKTNSKWVELEIDTGDANRTLFHRLIVDMAPRQIAVDADHSSPQVFNGAATTPGIQILLSIVVAAALCYVGMIGVIDSFRIWFGVTAFPLQKSDFYVVAILVTLLWLGYRRIQRPVYPIIQGYFMKTALNMIKPGKPTEGPAEK